MMMKGSRNTCTSCFGNGSCAQCNGSGLDAQRNHDNERRATEMSGVLGNGRLHSL